MTLDFPEELDASDLEPHDYHPLEIVFEYVGVSRAVQPFFAAESHFKVNLAKHAYRSHQVVIAL